MSENITDIEKWETKYPFLEKVWTTYKDFDKIVEVDNSKYDILCSQYILNKENEEISKYKDFCMKLMRNLGRYSSDPKIYKPTHERCNILYNWIYNSIGKKKTTEDVVNKCFKEYTEYMMDVNNIKICSKNSYDENFREPIKITLLDIFNNNTPAIIKALIDTNDSISTPGKKFVCECVRVYKNMYDSYCLKNRQGSGKNRTTCEQLDNFKESYGLFLTKLQGLDHKIPLLIDIDNELLAKCSKDESKLQLTPVQRQNTDLTLENRRFQIAGHADSTLEDGLPTHHESTDNSMKKNITTTIGTVAGASSLLALLYRFTPAKRMIFSGFRGSRGGVHSNMYEDGHNELFNDHEVENFSSYNQRYNIGYASV